MTTQAPTQQLTRADGESALALPEELELRPIEGMPAWLGKGLTRFFLRAVSMEEQSPRGLASMLTPVAGYFRRDRHVHPTIDPAAWRLEITGVAGGRVLTLADLRALPWEERVLVQECAGNGNHVMGSAGLRGQARWRGPSFESLLELCGGPGEATHFAFHGLDRLGPVKAGYHYGLSLDELRRARALVALEMNGAPLSRRHGFPARLVVPKVYSMSHVKWLGRIEGKTSPHLGIHNTFVFTNKELRDGRWQRVQARWIGLKSVISCCRRDGDGWLLIGSAWGGDRPIARVDVTTDGGATWQPAELDRVHEHFAQDPALRPADLDGGWSLFTYRWRPAAGEYTIAARAYDDAGAAQRMEEDPQVHGHFNQTRVKWRKVVVPAVG
ncbi:MAG TPA: molybdopterin-dependent oxidoreductase [Nannocystaceae bacterium]|nr:molybdopterin-dependent oxidoreductase [Nannocystaceae bacterium]